MQATVQHIPKSRKIRQESSTFILTNHPRWQHFSRLESDTCQGARCPDKIRLILPKAGGGETTLRKVIHAERSKHASGVEEGGLGESLMQGSRCRDPSSVSITHPSGQYMMFR